MTKKMTLLHTAPANVITFDALARELAPDIPVTHLLDEALLNDARTLGSITPELATRVQARLYEADDDSAVVLCTCSTIGNAAEAVTHPTAGQVLRVDRAMAEVAVNLGSKIVVMAALASTLQPTRELLLNVAAEQGKSITLVEVVCTEAWALLEAGNTEGYHQQVAACIREQVGQGDVIVLAQASMAGATAFCADVTTPILSSPRLGMEAAIQLYRARTEAQ